MMIFSDPLKKKFYKLDTMKFLGTIQALMLVILTFV